MDPEKVSIFTHPFLSFKVLTIIAIRYLGQALQFCLRHIFLIITLAALSLGIYFAPGPHQPVYYK